MVIPGIGIAIVLFLLIAMPIVVALMDYGNMVLVLLLLTGAIIAAAICSTVKSIEIHPYSITVSVYH
jgi:hypothetical protein